MRKIFKLPKKYLFIGVIVLVILGFFLLRPKENQQRFQFTQVKRQDIRSTVSSSGTLSGKDAANLKFKLSGKLAYLNVKAGDVVSKWDMIAWLDTQDLSIKLQQAQNTLRDKQAAAEKTLDDVKDHSKDETFTQKKDRSAAEVARDNAFDAVKEAQRAFQDAVIYSPLSGLITQTNGVPGQIVSSSDLIAQVVDNSQITFDTDIDEADIGKISVGQQTEVTLDAFEGETFQGSVDQIIPQTKTTSSGATVVTVKIVLKDAPKTFINGLSGQASIIISESKNALTIPQEALREDGTVFIIDGKSFKPVKVSADLKSDTDVEIKEGLNEGDQVLLNPPSFSNSLNQNRNPLFRLFGGGRVGR